MGRPQWAGRVPKPKLARRQAAECWWLTTLCQRLLKIGARVVRHGRYVAFQLAKVVVPRALFAKICVGSIGSDPNRCWHELGLPG